MLKAIIWDMDGTIVDSGNAISNSINFVRSHLGLKSLSKDIILKQINNPHINSSAFFYETLEFTKEQTALFTKYYDKACIEDVILFDGINELLKQYSKKYKMYIATNASDNFAYKILQNLNILDYFEAIVGANNVKNSKPKPDMINKILDEYHYKKDEVILIGDSQKDELSAKSARVDFVLVNWQQNPTKVIQNLTKQIDEI